MNRLLLIFFLLFLSHCKEDNTKKAASTEELTNLQRVRKECVAATISFYKDLASTSMVLKPALDKSSLDTIFSLVGNSSMDTGCHLFTSNIPVGRIEFYRDTLITDPILGLWFSLSDSCVYLYDKVSGPPAYDLTSFGKKYLLNQQKKIPEQWKR
jgi:hypothetical protein